MPSPSCRAHVACALAAGCLALQLFVVADGAPARPNVLLVTLDTVRADRLGAYGYRTGSTPALDRLARGGVRFADATTHAPLTAPAHAGMLTGLYPARFGLRDNGATPLPSGVPTLATILKKANYATAAFIAAFILDRAYGFAQGFDTFDARFGSFETGDKLKVERTAGQVLEPALAWLAKAPATRPFFAWVHLYDAHAPYSPPEPYRSRFRDRPYDGEVAYVDSAVASLVTALERRGVLDNTLVIAIADHGESLGEHGEEDHGLFLYDSTLRIPWLMRLPGGAHAGVVVKDQVRAIDLMPTVLDLLSVPMPPRLDGESVAPLIRGARRVETPAAYAETYYPMLHFGWSALQAIRVPEWKYIRAPKPELYDLRRDPGEADNVVDRQSNVAGRLDADMRAVTTSLGAPARGTKAAMPDADTIARLRSLGYVGFTPSASAHEGPDPKDMAPKLASFRRLLTDATDALKRRDAAVAIAKLKQALAINERSYDVHLSLGDAYLEMKDYNHAEGEYKAASFLNPTSADPLLAIANVQLAQNRTEDAGRTIAAAARLEPESAETSRAQGRVDEKLGRLPQALAEYREAVRRNPSDLRARANVVNVALRLREYDVAANELRHLLTANFDPAHVHFALGRVAEGRGDPITAMREYRQALAVDPRLNEARAALDRLSRR